MFVEHGPEVGSSFGDVPLTNHFETEPEVQFLAVSRSCASRTGSPLWSNWGLPGRTFLK